ncbi:MAG: hypothetical protein IJ491_02920 [Clostridia bacterium]|nr:hypothetical protein [Clostridia bacterium]
MAHKFLDELRKSTVFPESIMEKKEKEKTEKHNAAVLTQISMLFNDIKTDMKEKVKNGKYEVLRENKKRVTGECVITQVGFNSAYNRTNQIGYLGVKDSDHETLKYYHSNCNSGIPAATISIVSTKKGQAVFRTINESKSKYKIVLEPIVDEIYKGIKKLFKEEGIECELITEVNLSFSKSNYSRKIELKKNSCIFSDDWDEKFSFARIKIRAIAIY